MKAPLPFTDPKIWPGHSNLPQAWPTAQTLTQCVIELPPSPMQMQQDITGLMRQLARTILKLRSSLALMAAEHFNGSIMDPP